MGKFANFYDGVSLLLDKLADKIDPGKADVKSANYSTSVLNSLERIAENYEPGSIGDLQEVLPSAESLPSNVGVYVAAVLVNAQGMKTPYWYNMTGSDPSASVPDVPSEEGEL